MGPWEHGLKTAGPWPAPPAPTALPAPRRVALPLLWGETPLVRTGEPVRLGQRIADGPGDSIPLHASVSGRVAAVGPKTWLDGRRRTAVVLENDGQDRPDPAISPQALVDDLTDEALLALLYEAGIRLESGTPLAAALAGAGQNTETLLISAVDREPGCCVQEEAALRDPEACLSGIRLLERLLRPKEVWLAVSRGQRSLLPAARRWEGPRLQVAVVPDRYPSGEHRYLSQLVSGRPEETLVLPISAAAACGRAAYAGMPVVRQTVCVVRQTDRLLLEVPLGTPLSEVLRAAGAESSDVLLGGPMTGRRLRDPSVPLIQGMELLTVLPAPAPPVKTACIRCGRCAAVCPVGLQPWRSQLRRGARDFRSCLGCGVCQYSCPASLSLLRDMGRQRKEAVRVG